MRKLTHEEVIERLKVTNPSVRVIGKYINASVKLQVECKKCGYQWDARYGDLSKGHACPECGKKKCGMSQRMSHEEFISRINEMFDNSIEPLEKYTISSVKIKYKCKVCDFEWKAKPNTVLNGHGCPKCGHKRGAEKHTKTHCDFIKEMEQLHPDILVCTEYIGSHTKVQCECKNCGYTWWTKPNALLCGNGCQKCGYVKNGEMKSKEHNDFMNDFQSLNPNSQYIEIIGTYHRATEKIKCKCKLCNSILEVTPTRLLNDYQCTVCSGNSNSYPNRFSYAFLSLLPIENHIKEYSPDWIGKRKYDNYFEYKGNKYILEMDGGYHYENPFKDIKQVQAIDRYKDLMAEQHGIEVIRIECKESRFSYIKRNIMQSRLSEIFDLSNYDWQICNSKIERYSYAPIWEYANTHLAYSIPNIAKVFNKSKQQIERIIQLGHDRNCCDYELS